MVLYFWATWCTPCIEELAGLATSDRDDFVILSIAVREPPDEIAAFISAQSIEISPLLDLDGRVSDLYGVRGLPTSLFVDRDGMIVDCELNRPFGYLRKLTNDPAINLNGKGGLERVPPGVQIQNTRVRPSNAGPFLSELRFESRLQKSRVEELLGLGG